MYEQSCGSSVALGTNAQDCTHSGLTRELHAKTCGTHFSAIKKKKKTDKKTSSLCLLNGGENQLFHLILSTDSGPAEVIFWNVWSSASTD